MAVPSLRKLTCHMAVFFKGNVNGVWLEMGDAKQQDLEDLEDLLYAGYMTSFRPPVSYVSKVITKQQSPFSDKSYKWNCYGFSYRGVKVCFASIKGY